MTSAMGVDDSNLVFDTDLYFNCYLVVAELEFFYIPPQ